MSIKVILYIISAIFFIMAGFSVPRARWEWFAAAAFVLTYVV